MKLVEEGTVRSSDLLHMVIRTSVIYGVGDSKVGFVEYVAEELFEGRKVYVIEDHFAPPTLNTLLALALAEIIKLRSIGMLHTAGELVSRYKFALKITWALSLPKELVKKISINNMRRWITKRPRNSSLDAGRARKLLKNSL